MKLSLEHREETFAVKEGHYKDRTSMWRQESRGWGRRRWRRRILKGARCERTRVRVSDERARLEWLATWNMGDQSTLIYSQSQMGTGGRRRWKRRWFTKSEGGKQLEKFSKWVTLTHSRAELVEVTRTWKYSYTIHIYCKGIMILRLTKNCYFSSFIQKAWCEKLDIFNEETLLQWLAE